jgi:hypothetical protein
MVFVKNSVFFICSLQKSSEIARNHIKPQPWSNSPYKINEEKPKDYFFKFYHKRCFCKNNKIV